jgi:(E)-4-hydroxy-3-methylbut-2-enyl-diphosphate synthase
MQDNIPKISKRKTSQINIGNISIGSAYPVRVQSMTNTKTSNVSSTIKQIQALSQAGCEIVRLAVPDQASTKALTAIKKEVSVPLIADIHFNHNLALESIKAGIDGLRINPGNIGTHNKIKQVVEAAKSNGIPIRIGVNSGSIQKEILKKYKSPTPQAMVESAMLHVRILEKLDFNKIKISLKSSSVLDTIHAYQILADLVPYPLHIGITEAGTFTVGTVKSSIGLGILLWQGIGDTLRVSLTGDPVQEVKVAWEILRSLEIRQRGPEIISCPTCGRTEIDLLSLVQKVEMHLQSVTEVFKVAVMGCAVNGPGEAKEADLGIAGGKHTGIIFKKGKIIKKVPEKELLSEFIHEINNYIKYLQNKKESQNAS